MKLFSQNAISLATFFGGPLAAGYLVKKNYDALNQTENSKKALMYGVLGTILIFTGLIAIPETTLDKIPNALIPAIYTGVIYFIVERIQGQVLKNHKAEGGEFYSGWKAAGIGTIAMVIYFGIGFFIIIGADFISNYENQINPSIEKYDQQMAKFMVNESKALAVFDKFETYSQERLIAEFTEAVKLWQDNKSIIYQLKGINNLPEALLNQNKLLLKYCDLRLLHTSYILKALKENSSIYDGKIEKIGMEIEALLEELTQMNQEKIN